MIHQAMTVTIVCRGNIARSPFAAAVIRQEVALRGLSDCVGVLSRGVQGTHVDPEPVKHPNITHYKAMHSSVQQLLQDLDIDLSCHRSQPIDMQVLEHSDLILAMNTEVLDKLKRLFPSETSKMKLFTALIGTDAGFIDPDSMADAHDIREVFLEIRRVVIAGMPRILTLAKAER